MKKNQKRAFITGISGQDGSYLAEFLLKKNYKVFGLVRHKNKNASANIRNLPVTSIKGDLADEKSIAKAIKSAKPDEVYNLAGQTDSSRSVDYPKETFDLNYRAVGYVVNCAMKVNPKVRIFQASSSEMFGRTKPPQNEKSAFRPVTPYGEAKLKAHKKFVIGYRKKYRLFICSGFLFNHESPRRGENYVTRKITSSLAKIKLGLLDSFELGNIDTKRDWGFAGDYVEAMWKMLQQKSPEDFVMATGKSHTVRNFFNEAAKSIGLKVVWQGKGLKEVAKDKNGRIILRINKGYYRPIDVHYSLGNSAKIRKSLKWRPRHSFKSLVKMMAMDDLKRAKK